MSSEGMMPSFRAGDTNDSGMVGASVREVQRSFDEDGFVVLRGAVDPRLFAGVQARLLELALEYSGQHFESIRDPDIVALVSQDRKCEKYLYDNVRSYPDLLELGLQPQITGPVKALLGGEIVLLQKIPLRIDCPRVVRELAVWHQDYFYVRGAQATVTAWIPLLDTSYKEGCLLVMPGSHKQGAVAHDVNVLDKKHYPSTIFENPVRYVEMKAGDLLLFHSLLLHSSGNNISECIRFSVQCRYTLRSEPSDAAMGKRIEVT